MAGPEVEDRLLVLAPIGRDGPLVADAVSQAGIRAAIRSDVEQLCAGIAEGAGAVLLAEEALRPGGVSLLLDTLKAQPAWSDVPVLFLCTGGRQPTNTAAMFVDYLDEHANITILERPLRVPTLLSAVRSALRARRRQYEVRDHLEERKLHEEQLRETAKLESLGVLAGGIAHDFNNLLVGIMGAASLILDDLPHSDPNRKLLQNVVRASERAADLTRQLLAYSGKGRFLLEPVNLSSLIRDLITLLRTTASGSAEIRLELGDVAAMEADATQIRQLVMNLVINAVEALHESPGVVTVRTGMMEKGGIPMIRLEVSDTGCGMDESVRQRIFDPFFTTKFTGRGLGLSAALGIVRAHNGTIEVESAPGAGSTFRLAFPAGGAVDAPEPAEEAPADLSDTTTVLVVDDEEIVRTAARLALERYGHSVILAEDGQRALEIINANGHFIGCVLLDLTMPRMSGAEVLRAIQACEAGIPIVLSSGYSETEAARRFQRLPIAGFLQKPYSAAQIAQAIKSAVASGRTGRGPKVTA